MQDFQNNFHSNLAKLAEEKIKTSQQIVDYLKDEIAHDPSCFFLKKAAKKLHSAKKSLAKVIKLTTG